MAELANSLHSQKFFRINFFPNFALIDLSIFIYPSRLRPSPKQMPSSGTDARKINSLYEYW